MLVAELVGVVLFLAAHVVLDFHYVFSIIRRANFFHRTTIVANLS